VISADIPSKSKGLPGFGFVFKQDVKVTRREKQAPKSVNNSEVKKDRETDGT